MEFLAVIINIFLTDVTLDTVLIRIKTLTTLSLIIIVIKINDGLSVII